MIHQSHRWRTRSVACGWAPVSDLLRLIPILCDLSDVKKMGMRPGRKSSPESAGRVCVDKMADHLTVVRVSVYRCIEARGLTSHRVGCLWKLRLSPVDESIQKGEAAGVLTPRMVERVRRQGQSR